MGLFYFMAIEKRYYNDGEDVVSYLSCFCTNQNKIRFYIEDSETAQFVDLDADELKEFITDITFILKEINENNELH